MVDTILVHASWNLDEVFKDPLASQLDDPIVYLRRRLEHLGYEICTTAQRPANGCTWVWFWNAVGIRTVWWPRVVSKTYNRFRGRPTKRDFYQECLKAGLRDKAILFTWEPHATFPRNWAAKIHKKFPTILTWNDDYVEGRKYHKFCIPQSGKFPEVADVPFEARKLLVNISGNKFSPEPHELYSARRRSIRYFEQRLPNNFDLYGRGWNDPWIDLSYYPSYRGSPTFKWKVLPHYRFSLCYENSCEQGYVSEKIFDCMRSGCVPIYWGAPNISKYVDENTFVDRRKFASDAELEDFLASSTESDYDRYRNAIRRYLDSDKFKALLPEAFSNTIIRALSLA